MQDMKDKLIQQSQKDLDQAEGKMIQRIGLEMDRFNDHFEGLKVKMYKKIEELQGFVNAIKDEQDRFADRIK
jgi:hypothetical protein